MPSNRQHHGPVAGLPVLGVLARKQTYRHLALVLLLFPVGIANFVFVVTGLSVGVALLPLVIGIPILGLVLVGTTWLASSYARLLSTLSGRAIPSNGFSFGPEGFWAGLTDLATSLRPYVLLVAFLVSFPLTVVSFSLLAVVFALAFALVLAPVAGPLPVTTYRVTQDWALTTPVEWLGAAVLGFVLLLAGFWAVTLAGEALDRAAAAVLAGGGDGAAAGDPLRER
ncbi:MAG: sensor domain-containing protein [Haloarculaceae archaeon]